MACEPWQSAQVATRANPSSVTWPWYVSRYVSIRSVWQVPHSLTMATFQAAVSGVFTSWAEWQSMQTGALGFPFLRASAWTPVLNAVRILAWQPPHVAGTRVRAVRESGSDGGRISCTPWQDAQFGATESPVFSRALP